MPKAIPVGERTTLIDALQILAARAAFKEPDLLSILTDELRWYLDIPPDLRDATQVRQLAEDAFRKRIKKLTLKGNQVNPWRIRVITLISYNLYPRKFLRDGESDSLTNRRNAYVESDIPHQHLHIELRNLLHYEVCDDIKSEVCENFRGKKTNYDYMRNIWNETLIALDKAFKEDHAPWPGTRVRAAEPSLTLVRGVQEVATPSLVAPGKPPQLIELVPTSEVAEQEPDEDEPRSRKPFWRRPRYLAGLGLIPLVAVVVGWLVYPEPSPTITPLTIRGIDQVAGRPPQGYSYVLPAGEDFTPSDFDNLNAAMHNYADGSSWFLAHGGVAVSSIEIYVDLANEGNQDATVTGLAIQPTCTPPINGTLFYAPEIPGTQQQSPQITFDLDSGITYAQDALDGTGPGNYFEDHRLVVRPGDLQDLDIFATTKNADCRFTLSMTVDVNGAVHSEPLSSHGQDFEVTALRAPASAAAPFSGYNAAYAGGSANGGPSQPFKPIALESYAPTVVTPSG